MFIKDAYFFTITGSSLAEALPYIDGELADNRFTECGPMEYSRTGWVPPLDGSDELAHRPLGFVHIALRVDEKKAVGPAAKAAAKRKAAEIEKAEGRKVNRRERAALEDAYRLSLLQHIPATATVTHAYLCPSAGLFVVATSSRKRAEDVASYLRRTLGSLPIVPTLGRTVFQSMNVALTTWLREDQTPSGVTLGRSCKLSGGKETVTVTGAEDLAEAARGHLEGGVIAQSAELTVDGVGSFTVGADMAVKGIKYGEEWDEAINAAGESDDALAVADAAFVFEAQTLQNKILPVLIEAAGGWDE